MALGIAEELISNGIFPEIIEASNELLGLAGTFNYKDFEVEKFYHFFYKNDHLNSLRWLKKNSCDKVEIEWKDISSDTIASGKNYDFDSIFSIVSLSGRNFLKVFYILTKLLFFKPSEILDQKSAIDWSNQTFGKKFSKEVWIPLIEQKFGNNAKEISAYWLATRIKRHLSTKGRGIGKSKFGYLIDTYKPYVVNFEKKLLSGGGKIHYKNPVIKFESEGNNITKIVTSQKTIFSENSIIFSSLPLANLRSLLPNNSLDSNWNKFKNISVVVCILFLDKKISKNYWTTVSDKDFPFSAIIQQNRLYSKSQDEIVYLSRYCEENDQVMNLSDEDIFQSWSEKLFSVYGHLNFKNIKDYKIIRAKNAAPVPYIGIMKNLKKLNLKFNNFLFSGYENVLPEDRGVGNSIKLGRELAKSYLNVSKKNY